MRPKVPHPPKPETERRAYLSDRQKIAIVESQGGKCAIRGCESRRFEFDHVTPLWAGGTNDPDNWQAVCPTCHATKTKGEAKPRAKEKRLRGETGQLARRKMRQPKYRTTRSGAVIVNTEDAE